MGAETDDSAEAVTTSLSNLQLGSVDNGVHSQMLLHALLEERCINEALQEHRTQYDARTRRDDPTGLDRDGLASARQRYRDGLELLSQGTTPSAGQQMSISALLGRLLTQNEALPVMEDGQALNLDVGNEPRSQPSHSNHISSTEARGEQPSLQLARLRSDTSSVIDTLVPTHPMLEPSRYLRDFDELAVLGKGGYGIVYHVRNRLDGLQYAVKKNDTDVSTRSGGELFAASTLYKRLESAI
ncbi:hypothetical protein B0A55_00694 [Friedmanniomyces simplex]|uniref:Protein kinase domain-containing protein n=1 Tax=Friedmanniomyces simplex TaxID=329884 RepID=A0A4U0Y3Y4_9PEZI|nr:hypothetical protein B0A55_00694 [Friedmanniomyces simplex]